MMKGMVEVERTESACRFSNLALRGPATVELPALVLQGPSVPALRLPSLNFLLATVFRSSSVLPMCLPKAAPGRSGRVGTPSIEGAAVWHDRPGLCHRFDVQCDSIQNALWDLW